MPLSCRGPSPAVAGSCTFVATSNLPRLWGWAGSQTRNLIIAVAFLSAGAVIVERAVLSSSSVKDDTLRLPVLVLGGMDTSPGGGMSFSSSSILSSSFRESVGLYPSSSGGEVNTLPP